ncbi:4'-phosphopantetheinyl transferase family protein [Flavivirga jejuensis]|uniref:4'-phosphopantetheinyl transferase superfamily protein n=1 Tax=Flavivirga jejuensis TaxID=870487 RepID=A0ABT8WML4_9FLAO|nr:4'-phosphopantetheinyl transferase superfamily protein [Flavivirga jejuensis]MDO5974405.1 4'-phosphopantetheinyl transferase superfamily protein [Flavivirga jejuensis]
MSTSITKDLIFYSEVSAFINSEFLVQNFEFLKNSLRFGEQISLTQKTIPYDRLLGRALLFKALKFLNIKAFDMSQMTYNSTGKPQLKTSPHVNFSISHSNDIVVCAVSLYNVIGIDIEEVITVDLYNFKNHFSDSEWELLNYSSNPSLFFDLWTKKEALLKATGDGLSSTLKDIEIPTNRVCYNNTVWTFYKLSIMSNYCTYFACNNKTSFEIKKLHF